MAVAAALWERSLDMVGKIQLTVPKIP